MAGRHRINLVTGYNQDELKSLMQKGLRRKDEHTIAALNGWKNIKQHHLANIVLEDHCLIELRYLERVAEKSADIRETVESLLRYTYPQRSSAELSTFVTANWTELREKCRAISVSPKHPKLDIRNRNGSLNKIVRSILPCFDIYVALLVEGWIQKNEEKIMVAYKYLERLLVDEKKDGSRTLTNSMRRRIVYLILKRSISTAHGMTISKRDETYKDLCCLQTFCKIEDCDPVLILATAIVRRLVFDVRKEVPRSYFGGDYPKAPHFYRAKLPTNGILPFWCIDKHTFRGRYPNKSTRRYFDESASDALKQSISEEALENMHGAYEDRNAGTMERFMEEGIKLFVDVEKQPRPLADITAVSKKQYLERKQRSAKQTLLLLPREEIHQPMMTTPTTTPPDVKVSRKRKTSSAVEIQPPTKRQRSSEDTEILENGEVGMLYGLRVKMIKNNKNMPQKPPVFCNLETGKIVKGKFVRRNRPGEPNRRDQAYDRHMKVIEIADRLGIPATKHLVKPEKVPTCFRSIQYDDIKEAAGRKCIGTIISNAPKTLWATYLAAHLAGVGDMNFTNLLVSRNGGYYIIDCDDKRNEEMSKQQERYPLLALFMTKFPGKKYKQMLSEKITNDIEYFYNLIKDFTLRREDGDRMKKVRDNMLSVFDVYRSK